MDVRGQSQRVRDVFRSLVDERTTILCTKNNTVCTVYAAVAQTEANHQSFFITPYDAAQK